MAHLVCCNQKLSDIHNTKTGQLLKWIKEAADIAHAWMHTWWRSLQTTWVSPHTLFYFLERRKMNQHFYGLYGKKNSAQGLYQYSCTCDFYTLYNFTYKGVTFLKIAMYVEICWNHFDIFKKIKLLIFTTLNIYWCNIQLGRLKFFWRISVEQS